MRVSLELIRRKGRWYATFSTDSGFGGCTSVGQRSRSGALLAAAKVVGAQVELTAAPKKPSKPKLLCKTARG